MLRHETFHLGIHCLPKYPFRGFWSLKQSYLVTIYDEETVSVMKPKGWGEVLSILLLRRIGPNIYCLPQNISDIPTKEYLKF